MFIFHREVMHVDITRFVMVLCILVQHLRFINTTYIHKNERKRTKRGILSRTGICPAPTDNYHLKDTRLNFFGMAYQLPGEENPPCSENECIVDKECQGDKKCCRNHCGASICTDAVRDPHPCEMFQCPATKVCKIERVRCIDPICPDMLAISRPICVEGGPIYQLGKRSRIPRPNLFSYYQSLAQRSNIPQAQDVVYYPKTPYYQYIQPQNSLMQSYQRYKRYVGNAR